LGGTFGGRHADASQKQQGHSQFNQDVGHCHEMSTGTVAEGLSLDQRQELHHVFAAGHPKLRRNAMVQLDLNSKY
jgi:hypothetical protein